MPDATLPKTVLFIDHTAELGGGEIALFALVRGLDRRRYLPVVLLAADGALHAKLIEAEIETHLLPLSPRVAQARKDGLGGSSLLRLGDIAATLGYIWRVARFMRRRKIDLVHTNSLKADLIGGVAARLAGKRVIWHVRDRIADDYLPRRVVTVFRLLARFIPHGVVANSGATLATLNLPASKPCAVIHSGLDLEAFMSAAPKHPLTPPLSPLGRGGLNPRPNGEREGPAKREGEGGRPQRIIGLVGRISPWKGQHIFIEAAAIVNRFFPEVRYQIVGAALFGEEDYERTIRAQVETLGLGDHVIFAGFQNDIPAVMANFEILVHASTSPEPFGQVVVQGMAAGKPVVATAGGGVLDIVQDGETGILVPMGDSEAMANAIIRLLGDPALGRRMGESGSKRAHALFSIERTVEALSAFYDTISR